MLLFAGPIAVLLVGCASGSTPVPTAPSRLVPPTAAAGQLVGVLPNSDLAVGENQRFVLALLDDRNRAVKDASVRVRFFKVLDQQRAQLRSEAAAAFRSSPKLGDRGVYVTRTTFDEPGPWGAEVEARRPDGGVQTLRLAFEVAPTSKSPAVGAPVPASRTATAATPADVEKICSARPGDQFHALTVADALAQRKPLVVLFATPGFCESATCGPSLEVVQEATAPFLEKLNVVHVEIYEGGRPPNVVPAVSEWALPSEPWVFLVGADGKVVDKLEGGITTEELGPAVARLAGV